MAQYRFSAAIVCRSEGQSVVAAAAYRAGTKLQDERTGEIKDYSRRSWSVLYTQILTPENAPQWMHDRSRLWNGVEHREDRSTKRGTAQLARNLELSLPHELTHEQHVELVCEFVQAEFVDRGMVADIAIHAPPRRGDGTNHHAHVLLTMRDIDDGGFGNKNRAWNKDEMLEHWRERWADYQNLALEKYGFEARVDHRSLEDQGLDREPTQHLGHDAQAMEDQGIHTDRGDYNRRVKANNDNLALAKKDLADCEKRLAELRRQYAAEQMEQIQKTVKAAEAFWNKPEGRPPAPERPPEPEPPAPPPPPRGPRPSAAERIQQAQKAIRAADAFWKKGEQPGPSGPDNPPEPEPPTPTQLLQPQDASKYPESTPPPVSAGGKAASMPDDISKQQELAAQQEAARQKQAQDDEQARQKQAAADQDRTTEAAKEEAQRQAQARQEEENRLQQIRDAENKRIADLARENADSLVRQAQQMRDVQLRLDDFQKMRAQIDAYHAEQNRLAQDDKRKQEAERQAKFADKANEGQIHNASTRYAEALREHYDIRDPYASFAKAAMAEYGAFRRDREAYDQQIAKTTDPQERQAIDLRKRIEGADYLALTGDRIAKQSEIITGRRDSQEAVKERQKATDWRIQAQDFRQQLRDLHRERAPEKEREHERSETKPEPAKARQPQSRGPNRFRDLDKIIKEQDDLAKAKERERQKGGPPEPPDPERQKQQERERELQRKRDRER
jgi:hypothetical protein